MDDMVVTAVETTTAAPGGLGQVAELARSLASAQRVAEVVEAGALAVRQALDAATVSVGRLDAGHGTVAILRNVGDADPAGCAESYQLSDFPSLRTLVGDGGPWRYAAGQDDRDDAQEALLAERGWGASMGAPIVVGGRAWGGLYIARELGRPAFGDGDVELATVLAAVVGAGLAQVERVETLALLAQTDPMTGLANRRGADEALDAALRAHQESGAPVAVVLCDVDGLKRVNDTFGHAAGDLVLTRVSALLSLASAAHPGSTAARVGGDEFCLVLSGPPLPEVIETVQALSSSSRGLPFGAGVSCGVASAEAFAALGEEVTAKQLFRLADAAQYRAKRTGGVRVAVIGTDDVGELPADPETRSVGPARPGSLAQCVTALVSALAGTGGLSTLDRLVVAGAAAASWCDAAGWAVSTLDPGADVLVTRATTMARGGTDCFVTHKLSKIGFEFPLSACSMTAAAVLGGCFHAELADSGGPPAALAVLAAAGYTAMIGAGAPDAGGTAWLLELYTDRVSALPAGADEAAIAAVLRSLVALALEAGQPPARASAPVSPA
jgi:diguanylate cyclase (GGDEF)-like protein